MLLLKLVSALDISKIKNKNRKLRIKNGFEFLLKEKNLINLFSKTFCRINFLKLNRIWILNILLFFLKKIEIYLFYYIIFLSNLKNRKLLQTFFINKEFFKNNILKIIEAFAIAIDPKTNHRLRNQKLLDHKNQF